MAKIFQLGFILSILCIGGTHLFSKGQFPARGFAKVLTDEEASLRLERYRAFLVRDLNQTVYHQNYALRFRLRHMPRRGEESVYTGTLSGLALGHGTIRIDMDSVSGDREGGAVLLRTPGNPEAWRYSKGLSKSLKLESKDLLDPLVEGVNQSPFELLMPFVFWDATYEKSGRVAGRPAHVYRFSCPEWVRKAQPTWVRITLALDDAYEAPLRVETFSSRSVPHKTFLLNSLKKIESTWIVKTFDCKNRADMSNTRFEVLSAALQLDLDPVLFTPEGLGRELAVPPEAFLSTK
jgi:hypothetical protein